MKPVHVNQVTSRRDLRRFINLPWEIYRGDPNWVPPLKSDVRAAFSRSRNPFFTHSQAQPYLAWQGGRVVGRICAIRYRNHEAIWRDSTGFFGWFECVEDVEVARALVDKARSWLSAQGLMRMRGPTNFTTNDPCGLLVDGDWGPPRLLMTYNPRYYASLLESAGLQKAKDLYAWRITAELWQQDKRKAARLARSEKLLARRYDVRLRQMEVAHFEHEVGLVLDLYNAAWEKNWGFAPMTEAEIVRTAKELRPVLDSSLVIFAEVAGETVGFVLAVPDFNQVLKKMNGRLLPFGVFRALRERRRIRGVRVIALGVLPQWRGKGIDALLYGRLITNALAGGYTESEQSWTLEDNHKINVVLERVGAERYRTYRLYERAV